MEQDVECPYCGAGQSIDDDDIFGFEDDDLRGQDCLQCGKTFAYQTFMTRWYRAQKADCWNGGEHEYFPAHTTCFEGLREIERCQICGHVKESPKQ